MKTNPNDEQPIGDDEDAIMDSLLREYARAGKGDDEAFVQSVEDAIDVETAEAAEPIDEKVIAMTPRGVSPLWRMAAMLFLFGAGVLGMMVFSDAHRESDIALAPNVADTRAQAIEQEVVRLREAVQAMENYGPPAPFREEADLLFYPNKNGLESEDGAMLNVRFADASASGERDFGKKRKSVARRAVATKARGTIAPNSANPASGRDFARGRSVAAYGSARDQPVGADLEDGFGGGVFMGGGGFGFGLPGNVMDQPMDGERGFGVPGWQQNNPAPKDRERYGQLVDNRFDSPFANPLSTFSIDVDTASYTNLRRTLRDRRQVQKDAVRIEEMINYFPYNYPQPEGDHPFSVNLEVASCPWKPADRLVKIGLKGRDIERADRPAANLVFLLDVSGSMADSEKLPFVKSAMSTLVESLTAKDTVTIAVYAGAEGLALPPTPGDQRPRIKRAMANLNAGGSTNGGAGIKLAYSMAQANYKDDGINRVILCTDGDFNVGTTGDGELVDLVRKGADGGVFLSVLGFGRGNLNDGMLEAITNKGDGAYYYIDSPEESEKVFTQDLMGTLVTIAKDVKIQVEFNPAQVARYRLIGYANRMLRAEDFENDKIDAGEIGAGHNVTALYQIEPANPGAAPAAKDLRYQVVKNAVVASDEMLTVKLRYKKPDGDTSILLEQPLRDTGAIWQGASHDFQFASAVAAFGMCLRDSEHKGAANLQLVRALAEKGKGDDAKGWRAEFGQLVRQAQEDSP